MVSKKLRGFSLIELIVVMVIMGVLLTLAVPFAQSWMQGVDDHRAKTMIEHAYQNAKAIAMRSPTGSSALTSAGLQLNSDGVLLVYKGDPMDASLCCYEPVRKTCKGSNNNITGEHVAWQGEMPKKTLLKIEGLDLKKTRATKEGSAIQWAIPLNDKGLSLKEVAPNTYRSQLYEISLPAGDKIETYPLH